MNPWTKTKALLPPASARVWVSLLFALLEPWSQDAPLGREGEEAADSSDLTWYPVHRLDPGTDFGSLLTEPAKLGPPSDGTEPTEVG